MVKGDPEKGEPEKELTTVGGVAQDEGEQDNPAAPVGVLVRDGEGGQDNPRPGLPGLLEQARTARVQSAQAVARRVAMRAPDSEVAVRPDRRARSRLPSSITRWWTFLCLLSLIVCAFFVLFQTDNFLHEKVYTASFVYCHSCVR